MIFAVAFLLWPVIKSAVFLSALTISLCSRKKSRRATAERVLRMMCGGPG
ncbi:hypothetical protein [Actinoplanes sp. NPDC026619]